MRCLCCGAECCCACFSCCNACCPSPRRKRQQAGGYYQQPPIAPPPQPYPTYSQYVPPAQQQQAMSYGPAASAGFPPAPRTATFNAPTAARGAPVNYNEDALPAMPSWNTSANKHVEMTAEEREAEEEVEMTRLNNMPGQQQQAQGLLTQQEANPWSSLAAHAPQRPYDDDHFSPVSPIGSSSHGLYAVDEHGSTVSTIAPQHAYERHAQFVPSQFGSQHSSVYPPTYRSQSPPRAMSPMYRSQTSYSPVQSGPYEPSIPPSYTSRAPQPQQQVPPRRPVQGSWRDV